LLVSDERSKSKSPFGRLLNQNGVSKLDRNVNNSNNINNKSINSNSRSNNININNMNLLQPKKSSYSNNQIRKVDISSINNINNINNLSNVSTNLSQNNKSIQSIQNIQQNIKNIKNSTEVLKKSNELTFKEINTSPFLTKKTLQLKKNVNNNNFFDKQSSVIKQYVNNKMNQVNNINNNSNSNVNNVNALLTKSVSITNLNQIKDKDPQTVSWFGVLFKDFDPSLEQAQQYSADYDSESRRVADVLSKTADGKGIDYNLLNEKERGEFDADRDRFCEYEKIISPTAFKNFLEGASSEEEKKQIKEKYEAEEPRRRAISEQSSSNFLSRYKLREKDSKERSINLRNQVRSKEDAITNNPKYQKTIDVVKGVYDKMREKLDGLKKDSNE